MTKVRTKIIAMMMLSVAIFTFSCEEEFSEEDALNAQQSVDLAIYVVNNSAVSEDPVEGARVTVSQNGETREVMTDATGAALFPEARIGGYVYKIEAENFTTLSGSSSISTSNFRIGQVTARYELNSTGTPEQMATLKGVVEIESNLTNEVTEYAGGITLNVEVNLDNKTLNFQTTTDEQGNWELQVPTDANGGTYVRIHYPDIEMDQTIAYMKTSDDQRSFPEVVPAVNSYPTLFTMYTDDAQNHDNFPYDDHHTVYGIAQDAPDGQETARISWVSINDDGEITNFNIADGGDYSDAGVDSVDIEFIDITGAGSGGLVRISVETYSNLSTARSFGQWRYVSQGSGYADEYLNFNEYEEPSFDDVSREYDITVRPGTTTVINVDYGTGTYRANDLD